MPGLASLALIMLTAGGYAAGLVRLRRRGDHWPAARTGCLLAGAAAVAAAVLPPISRHDENFPVHAVQHLLLGMAGPVFLALSAPGTLALRTLPLALRRGLLAFLHSRPVTFMVRLDFALAVNLGGVYVLYLTGLYQQTAHHDLVHAAVHLHMFVAGCVLSWAIVGIDPVRRRTAVRTRLVALALAGAGHDILAKILYAHGLPAGGGPLPQRQLGAELLYYGGTVTDVMIAVIVLAQWYRSSGRELARASRRSAAVPDQRETGGVNRAAPGSGTPC